MVIILFIHSYPLCLLSWVFNPQISPQRNRLGISQGKQITQRGRAATKQGFNPQITQITQIL